MRTARTGSSSAASSVVRRTASAALRDAKTRKRGRADRRMRRLCRADQGVQRARVRIVWQVANRVGPDQRSGGRVRREREQTLQRFRPAGASAGERLGARHQPRAASVRPPLRERVHRPRRLLVRVAFVAGVGNREPFRVLRRRQAHRVIADARLDAQHRPRHVALDARAARASGEVTRVRRHGRADRLVAAGAERVARRPELRVLVDVGQVRVAMATRAGGAAAKEALALPQSHRVV